MPDLPRDLASRYAVEGALGRGGMGQVLAARDLRLGRSVAVKFLPEEFADDPERIARLQREARALAKLSHPNIAMLYSLEFTERQGRVLILERVEGETLSARIRREPPAVPEALRICAQIAAALECAHERGVIHRDLKPGNVMLTSQGQVKVLDFGLAKVTGPDPSRRPGEESEDLAITREGVALGTPGYMGPEQIRGAPAERKADIFAFGCVLFECLAGVRAFPGSRTEDALLAALSREPVWGALPGGVPPAIRALLERCLAKDPRERLSNMAEARAVIEEALGITSATGGLSRVRPVEEPLTTFVGREQELEEAGRLLRQTRLLTLTGPGGSGKTRLALRLANLHLASYPDGVWLVDFAPLSDAARVPQAVATAIGLRERGGASVPEAIASHLADRCALLVLDNCEHLLRSCAALAEPVLARSPSVRILATSREPLRVSGEHLYPVPPLHVSSSERGSRVGSAPSEAARLFAERAAAVQPRFALNERNVRAVEEICRRLEGIPLALELAAARVRVLSLDRIRAKLDDQLRLLADAGAPGTARHRTVAAAIDWSYRLLTRDERTFLYSLSVFAGGWTLEAAAAVCGSADDEFGALDLLSRLVDKSLVIAIPGEGSRYRYRLLETVREYARDRLTESGREGPLRAAHVLHFLDLAERAAPQLTGPSQAEWLNVLEEEHENLLTALWWCGRAKGDDLHGVRIAAALWRFWFGHGHFELGRSVLRAVLSGPGALAPTAARAEALQGEGALAFHQNDFAAGNAAYEESLAICRELDDDRGQGFSLGGLGNLAMGQGNYAAAKARYLDALSRFERTHHRRGIGLVLSNLGRLAELEGDERGALDLYERGMEIFREVGDLGSLGLRLSSLGLLSLRLGYVERARARLLECLRVVPDLEEPHAGAYALERSAVLVERLGDPALAARLWGAADTIRERIRSPLTPKERQEQDDALKRIQSALGGARFAALWMEGTAWTFERAVEEALARLEEPDQVSSKG